MISYPPIGKAFGLAPEDYKPVVHRVVQPDGIFMSEYQIEEWNKMIEKPKPVDPSTLVSPELWYRINFSVDRAIKIYKAKMEQRRRFLLNLSNHSAFKDPISEIEAQLLGI